MTKLAKLSLAVTVLVPASLAAQTVAPPVPWEDVPEVELDLPSPPSARPTPPATAAPPPGVTWQRPASPPPAVAPAPVPQRPSPVPAPPQQTVAAPAPARVAPPPAPAPSPVVAARTPPPPVAPRIPRVDRGFVMPPYWMAPQFHVRDWQAYGLAAPASGQRWVRYYDDTLLIDGNGRVIDIRHDVDWAASRQAWAYGPGVPVYVGEGEFHPGAEDYAYVQSHGGEAYAEAYDDRRYDYAYRDCRTTYGPGYYPPPACYGAYVPYGYGWGGVTITETTVTTHGCCAEPKVVVREYPARTYKRKRVPRRGERG